MIEQNVKYGAVHRARAEGLVSQLQIANSGRKRSVETTARMRELADQLAAARSRMSLTEQQLSTVHQKIESLENAAAEVPDCKAQLAAANIARKTSEMRLQRLTEESSLQQKKLQELATLPDGSSEKIHRLEQDNKELGRNQIDLLKSQLLLAAA